LGSTTTLLMRRLAPIVLLLLPAPGLAQSPEQPASAPGQSDPPTQVPNNGAEAVDPYTAYIALMREIARVEGRISDLRKDRDEALAELRRNGQDRASTNAGPPLDARIESVRERFAADIRDAQAALQALEQQRGAVQRSRP